MRHLTVVLAAMLLGMFAAAGCATRATLVRGVAPLNLNAEGESTPVDVRIYMLSDDDAFSRAGYAALWTEPARVLSGDLLGTPMTVTILPGSPGDPPRRIELDGNVGQAAWVGLQLLVRHEGELPRTLLVPIARFDDAIIEASGYGLRLVTKR